MRLVCAVAAFILAQPALAAKPSLSVTGHGIYTFMPDPDITQTIQIAVSALQFEARTSGTLIAGELGSAPTRYPVTQIEPMDIPIDQTVTPATCVTYQVSDDPAVDFWYAYLLIVDGAGDQPDMVALAGGEKTRCTLALSDPSYLAEVVGWLTTLTSGNFVITP